MKNFIFLACMSLVIISCGDNTGDESKSSMNDPAANSSTSPVMGATIDSAATPKAENGSIGASGDTGTTGSNTPVGATDGSNNTGAVGGSIKSKSAAGSAAGISGTGNIGDTAHIKEKRK